MADILATLQHERTSLSCKSNAVHLLESRKTNLSHQLASLTSTHTVPFSPDASALSDDSNLLSNLFARTKQSDLKNLEKFHRLAGITLFIPNNPNEGSISQDGKPDELLGLRFETVQDGTARMSCLLTQGNLKCRIM
jgi:hypothetical protein